MTVCPVSERSGRYIDGGEGQGCCLSLAQTSWRALGVEFLSLCDGGRCGEMQRAIR